MTDFDKYIRGRIGKILLELDNQITLQDNCLADIERHRATAENAIFDIMNLGKLEEVYVAGINAGKDQLVNAANNLFKNLPPLPNKSEDKCTLHFVSERTLGINSCATLIKSMPTDQAIQIMKSDITGQPQTTVIDGELVVAYVR